MPRPASIRGGLPSEARSARRPAHHAPQAEILVPASVEPRSQIPNPAQRVDGSAPLPRGDRPSITVDTPSARTAAKHGVTGLGFFQELLRVHFRFICPTINLHCVGDQDLAVVRMDRRRHRRCPVCAQRDRVVLHLVSPTYLFVAEDSFAADGYAYRHGHITAHCCARTT